MNTPVAYLLQDRSTEGARLARDLADAGAEVYAFASAADLLLAAAEALPDVLVGDDPTLERAALPCPVVSARPGSDPTASAVAAVRALLRATFGAPTATPS